MFCRCPRTSAALRRASHAAFSEALHRIAKGSSDLRRHYVAEHLCAPEKWPPRKRRARVSRLSLARTVRPKLRYLVSGRRSVRIGRRLPVTGRLDANGIMPLWTGESQHAFVLHTQCQNANQLGMKRTLGTVFLLLPVFYSACRPALSPANPQWTSTPCPNKVLQTQNIAD